MNDTIANIAIANIRVINPRHRDRKKFEQIVQSIKTLGLKKPIQVSLRVGKETEEEGYDLVCGQGRMEAYQVLGYKEIPAVVVSISKEDRLLRSLVENIARRFPRPADLIIEIERLKDLGYSNVAIGDKLGLNDSMVGNYLALKRAGEERLLEHALSGKIPISVAMDIARAEQPEAQRELLNAYENGDLGPGAIRTVKRIIEQRRFLGKKRQSGTSGLRSKATAEGFVSAYKRESNRQRLIIKKAGVCDNRLRVLVSGFNQLLGDENFLTLLRAESLDSMPQYLAERIQQQQEAA
mgnify:CR=1 FL=1